MADKHVNLTGN